MGQDQFLSDERGPVETTPMMAKGYSGSPPKDKCRLVWMIVLLNGIGVLLPWNMFITIAPAYYVDYWFSPGGNKTEYATNFMSALGMASQFPNLFINIFNVLVPIGGALLLRIAGPLVVNCLSISVVIILIAVVPVAEESMGWFYITTLVIVGIINLSNGLYQNSIFGMFADFPAEYSNALVLGNNICGTFTTLLSTATILLFPNSVTTPALIYFSISLIVLILCGISLFQLTRLEFYQYWVDKGNAARSLASENTSGFSQYLQCWSKCWVQLWNVFFIFFVTLTIFPTIMVATPVYREPGEPWPSIWPENLYILITTFLCFNVFATVGSFLANFIQFPGPRFLWIPVLLRGLFIPFFMFCNYRAEDRTLPVLFKNEWWFFAGGVLMASSSGYLSSLAMMYAPRVVPSSQAKIAGMTAALCLMLGIFCGLSFTWFVAFLTTR